MTWIRTFPRRKIYLDFDLLLTGKPVPAVVTDISPYGMGIFLKGRPDLKTPFLDLDIRDMDLSTRAAVVWKKEVSSGIRLGLSYVRPVAGRLSSYGLADLVIGIYRARKTGILSISAEQWSRRIFFKDGEMAYAVSDIEDEQTGRVLLASGMISPRQYLQSLASAERTGRSQEAVLVDSRDLTPANLVGAVRQTVEAVIINLCDVEDAKFSFVEGALPAQEMIVMQLNSADLMFRGAKQTERLHAVWNRHFTPGALLHPSAEKESVLRRLSLDQQELRIFSLLQKGATLEELFEQSPVSKEETIRTVYGLLAAHAIDVEAKEAAQGAAGEDGEEEGAGLKVDKSLEEKIDALYREHRKLGYHGVLGLRSQTASRADIKHAYHAMAKEYHPDRYLLTASDELKQKLNVIFAYINEAYREISRGAGAISGEPEVRMQQRESPEERNRGLAKAKYREGREHLAAGNGADAMVCFGQAVYLDASVADYHFYYGVSLLRNERMREAEESFRKALQFSPHDGRYLTGLGNLYLALGFKTRALRAFEQALKAEPSRADAAEGLRRADKIRD